MYHCAFLTFTSLLDHQVEPGLLCVFGPWLAIAPFAFRDHLLRLAVCVTGLAALWPQPITYACSLCALLAFAQDLPALAGAALGLSLALYAQYCPCSAPSETQILAIAWTECVHFIQLVTARLI